VFWWLCVRVYLVLVLCFVEHSMVGFFEILFLTVLLYIPRGYNTIIRFPP
jgi:hypothetical protein